MQSIFNRITFLLLLLATTIISVAQPDSIGTRIGKDKRDANRLKAEPVDLKNVHSKEISAEVACNPGCTVYVDNISRKTIIKTSTDNKVRVVTTIFYSGDSKLSDADWFNNLQLDVKGSNNHVVVKSDFNSGDKKAILSNGRPTYSGSGEGVARFDSIGKWVNRKTNIRRDVTIYIPATANLDLETTYADVFIENNIHYLDARITNASLTLKNADSVTIFSTYGNINLDNSKNAKIQIDKGRLIAGNIDKLDLDTKHSTIELASAKEITMQSVDDQYEIEEVTTLKSHKTYGSLYITSLKNSFDLNGSNADIKIRQIDAGASLIKITDQYADVRVSVSRLPNFTVEFDGTMSNVYTSFEKESEKATADTAGNAQGVDKPTKFKANVGNTSGKHTVLQLNCSNCTVDLR